MSNALLVTAVYVKKKLGDNTLNNERLPLVKTKLAIKNWRIVALLLLPYNISIIAKLKGHIKGRFISKVLIFLKKSIVRFKIIRKFVEVERNFYKTFNKSASINTNQVLLSCNRLELSPWSYTHVFKKIATTLRWNSTSKALLSSSFSTDNGQTSRLSIFYCIPNHKNVIPKYLKNVLTDSA